MAAAFRRAPTEEDLHPRHLLDFSLVGMKKHSHQQRPLQPHHHHPSSRHSSCPSSFGYHSHRHHLQGRAPPPPGGVEVAEQVPDCEGDVSPKELFFSSSSSSPSSSSLATRHSPAKTTFPLQHQPPSSVVLLLPYYICPLLPNFPRAAGNFMTAPASSSSSCGCSSSSSSSSLLTSPSSSSLSSHGLSPVSSPSGDSFCCDCLGYTINHSRKEREGGSGEDVDEEDRERLGRVKKIGGGGQGRGGGEKGESLEETQQQQAALAAYMRSPSSFSSDTFRLFPFSFEAKSSCVLCARRKPRKKMIEDQEDDERIERLLEREDTQQEFRLGMTRKGQGYARCLVSDSTGVCTPRQPLCKERDDDDEEETVVYLNQENKWRIRAEKDGGNEEKLEREEAGLGGDEDEQKKNLSSKQRLDARTGEGRIVQQEKKMTKGEQSLWKHMMMLSILLKKKKKSPGKREEDDTEQHEEGQQQQVSLRSKGKIPSFYLEEKNRGSSLVETRLGGVYADKEQDTKTTRRPSHMRNIGKVEKGEERDDDKEEDEKQQEPNRLEVLEKGGSKAISEVSPFMRSAGLSSSCTKEEKNPSDSIVDAGKRKDLVSSLQADENKTMTVEKRKEALNTPPSSCRGGVCTPQNRSVAAACRSRYSVAKKVLGNDSILAVLFHSWIPREILYLLQWFLPNFLVFLVFAFTLSVCLRCTAPAALDFILLLVVLLCFSFTLFDRRRGGGDEGFLLEEYNPASGGEKKGSPLHPLSEKEQTMKKEGGHHLLSEGESEEILTEKTEREEANVMIKKAEERRDKSRVMDSRAFAERMIDKLMDVQNKGGKTIKGEVAREERERKEQPKKEEQGGGYHENDMDDRAVVTIHVNTSIERQKDSEVKALKDGEVESEKEKRLREEERKDSLKDDVKEEEKRREDSSHDVVFPSSCMRGRSLSSSSPSLLFSSEEERKWDAKHCEEEEGQRTEDSSCMCLSEQVIPSPAVSSDRFLPSTIEEASADLLEKTSPSVCSVRTAEQEQKREEKEEHLKKSSEGDEDALVCLQEGDTIKVSCIPSKNTIDHSLEEDSCSSSFFSSSFFSSSSSSRSHGTSGSVSLSFFRHSHPGKGAKEEEEAEIPSSLLFFKNEVMHNDTQVREEEEEEKSRSTPPTPTGNTHTFSSLFFSSSSFSEEEGREEELKKGDTFLVVEEKKEDTTIENFRRFSQAGREEEDHRHDLSFQVASILKERLRAAKLSFFSSSVHNTSPPSTSSPTTAMSPSTSSFILQDEDKAEDSAHDSDDRTARDEAGEKRSSFPSGRREDAPAAPDNLPSDSLEDDEGNERRRRRSKKSLEKKEYKASESTMLAETTHSSSSSRRRRKKSDSNDRDRNDACSLVFSDSVFPASSSLLLPSSPFARSTSSSSSSSCLLPSSHLLFPRESVSRPPSYCGKVGGTGEETEPRALKVPGKEEDDDHEDRETVKMRNNTVEKDLERSKKMMPGDGRELREDQDARHEKGSLSEKEKEERAGAALEDKTEKVLLLLTGRTDGSSSSEKPGGACEIMKIEEEESSRGSSEEEEEQQLHLDGRGDQMKEEEETREGGHRVIVASSLSSVSPSSSLYCSISSPSLPFTLPPPSLSSLESLLQHDHLLRSYENAATRGASPGLLEESAALSTTTRAHPASLLSSLPFLSPSTLLSTEAEEKKIRLQEKLEEEKEVVQAEVLAVETEVKEKKEQEEEAVLAPQGSLGLLPELRDEEKERERPHEEGDGVAEVRRELEKRDQEEQRHEETERSDNEKVMKEEKEREEEFPGGGEDVLSSSFHVLSPSSSPGSSEDDNAMMTMIEKESLLSLLSTSPSRMQAVHSPLPQEVSPSLSLPLPSTSFPVFSCEETKEEGEKEEKNKKIDDSSKVGCVGEKELVPHTPAGATGGGQYEERMFEKVSNEGDEEEAAEEENRSEEMSRLACSLFLGAGNSPSSLEETTLNLPVSSPRVADEEWGSGGERGRSGTSCTSSPCGSSPSPCDADFFSLPFSAQVSRAIEGVDKATMEEDRPHELAREKERREREEEKERQEQELLMGTLVMRRKEELQGRRSEEKEEEKVEESLLHLSSRASFKREENPKGHKKGVEEVVGPSGVVEDEKMREAVMMVTMLSKADVLGKLKLLEELKRHHIDKGAFSSSSPYLPLASEKQGGDEKPKKKNNDDEEEDDKAIKMKKKEIGETSLLAPILESSSSFPSSSSTSSFFHFDNPPPPRPHQRQHEEEDDDESSLLHLLQEHLRDALALKRNTNSSSSLDSSSTTTLSSSPPPLRSPPSLSSTSSISPAHLLLQQLPTQNFSLSPLEKTKGHYLPSLHLQPQQVHQGLPSSSSPRTQPRLVLPPHPVLDEKDDDGSLPYLLPEEPEYLVHESNSNSSSVMNSNTNSHSFQGPGSRERAALQHYMSLIRECHRNKDSRGAVGVLELLHAEGRVSPDTQLLNYVLLVCASAGDRVMTDRLFAFMDATGRADLVTYNTLLKSFTATGQLAEAERVFAMMDGDGEDGEGEEDDDEKQGQGQRATRGLYGSSCGDNGGVKDEKGGQMISEGTMKGKRKGRRKIAPDAVTFNLLVNAAVSAGQLDQAWGYIDRLKKANLAPDKFTISSVIKSLQPGQNRNHTKRALELMDHIDVCEDLVLLSTCIDACTRLGDLRRLRELLAKFDASNLKPNAHAYGTLIKAYGRLGNIRKVWSLWVQQQQEGVEPTNYTLGCMIDCLATNGLIAEALQLFKRLVESGTADAVLFSILVKGLSRHKDSGAKIAMRAYRWLKEKASIEKTRASGFDWNDTERSMKNTKRRDGGDTDVEDSDGLVLPTRDFLTRETDDKEGGQSYQTSKVPHENRRDERIEETAAGSLSDFPGRTAVSEGDRKSDFLRSFSSSFTSLNKGFKGLQGENPHQRTGGTNEENQKEEREVLDVNSCYVQALNTICFNSLLHLCVSNGNLEDAVELFKDMQKHPRAKPDLITYSTIIKGLCCSTEENALEAALCLFQQMHGDAGIVPDAIVYNTLIQGAATRRNVPLAELLLVHMFENNVRPSSYTLCQCVKLYGRCGNLTRALELALELPKRYRFSMDSYVYTALIAACTHNGAPILAGILALRASIEQQELPPPLFSRLANHLQANRDFAERELTLGIYQHLLHPDKPEGDGLVSKIPVLRHLTSRCLNRPDQAREVVQAVIRELRSLGGQVYMGASFGNPGSSSSTGGYAAQTMSNCHRRSGKPFGGEGKGTGGGAGYEEGDGFSSGLTHRSTNSHHNHLSPPSQRGMYHVPPRSSPHRRGGGSERSYNNINNSSSSHYMSRCGGTLGRGGVEKDRTSFQEGGAGLLLQQQQQCQPGGRDLSGVQQYQHIGGVGGGDYNRREANANSYSYHHSAPSSTGAFDSNHHRSRVHSQHQTPWWESNPSATGSSNATTSGREVGGRRGGRGGGWRGQWK